ncbi:MAG: hypothetical protein RI953_1527 [Pseudomonadota bacterium]|jgi:hypothetical protein
MTSELTKRLAASLSLTIMLAWTLAACRRVDTSVSSGLATKPKEMFEEKDAKSRCLERSKQLRLSDDQRSKLCSLATSSFPVDCFKRKTEKEGVASDTAIFQCRTPNLPH